MIRRPIVTSLSPNLELDDLRLAASLLCRPTQQQHGSANEQLTDDLAQYFPNGKIYLTNSGRSALYVAIKSLRLQNTDEVLMQAYTCNAVPNPVLWAGAIPVYVDIDKKTLNMSVTNVRERITPRTKVIIVQHTFGYPAPIEEITTLARKHNIVVIEDCAHALGARVNNTLVGNFGDMAIFSFGRDKIISSVYGGFLLVNAAQYIPAADTVFQTLPLPHRWWTIQQLLHPILFAFGLRYYFAVSIGKIVLEISKRLHVLSRAVTEAEKHGKKPVYFPAKLPNALAALAAQQLKKLSVFQAHRTAIADFYSEHLDTAQLEIAQSDSMNTSVVEPAYLRYTVLVENPETVLAHAKRNDVMLGDWYNAAITPPGTDTPAVRYTPGSCPIAEQISKHSLNLPTHINITIQDAEKIVSIVNSSH